MSSENLFSAGNPYVFRVDKTTSPDYPYRARIDTTLRDRRHSLVFSAIGATEEEATRKLVGLIEGSPYHPVSCKGDMLEAIACCRKP